jgi:Lrp/AsnC family transcriptional regulator, leucine-responsive regulatory protein
MIQPLIPLDDLDLKLLALLSTNARATWAELATQLGLSAPAIAERTRKLEERGVIASYTVLIDPERVGAGLLAFVAVQVNNQQRSNFLKRILEMPEILECHHMAGEDDYWLKLRCSSTRDLERIVSEDLKAGIPDLRTRTTIALSTLKDSPTPRLQGR